MFVRACVCELNSECEVMRVYEKTEKETKKERMGLLRYAAWWLQYSIGLLDLHFLLG